MLDGQLVLSLSDETHLPRDNMKLSMFSLAAKLKHLREVCLALSDLKMPGDAREGVITAIRQEIEFQVGQSLPSHVWYATDVATFLDGLTTAVKARDSMFRALEKLRVGTDWLNDYETQYLSPDDESKSGSPPAQVAYRRTTGGPPSVKEPPGLSMFRLFGETYTRLPCGKWRYSVEEVDWDDIVAVLWQGVQSSTWAVYTQSNFLVGNYASLDDAMAAVQTGYNITNR